MFIGQCGFGTLILLTGILEFILNRKAYRALDIKNLISMTMTQASENIIKHKQLRSINNKILTLPLIALVIWTILVAGGYTWNPKVIIITVSMIGVSIFWGLYQMKENQKKLENVLVTQKLHAILIAHVIMMFQVDVLVIVITIVIGIIVSLIFIICIDVLLFLVL